MKAILKIIAVAGVFMMFGNGVPAIASNSIHSSPMILPANFMEMKISEFIKLSAKDFSMITGKKMGLKEKVSFTILKKDMKKSLKSNPDQTVTEYLATIDKKDKTALIIIGIVVLAILIVVIVNSIDVGLDLGE